ncbi:hypothetical protein KCU62_g255, partial [Aureobasidium sp. EXF-3399]
LERYYDKLFHQLDRSWQRHLDMSFGPLPLVLETYVLSECARGCGPVVHTGYRGGRRERIGQGLSNDRSLGHLPIQWVDGSRNHFDHDVIAALHLLIVLRGQGLFGIGEVLLEATLDRGVLYSSHSLGHIEGLSPAGQEAPKHVGLQQTSWFNGFSCLSAATELRVAAEQCPAANGSVKPCAGYSPRDTKSVDINHGPTEFEHR